MSVYKSALIDEPDLVTTENCEVLQEPIIFHEDGQRIPIEETEDRDERREEGYVSSSISDSNDRDFELLDEGRGYPDDESDRVCRTFGREGVGNCEYATVLAEQFFQGFNEVLRRGQTRIVRESVTFNSSATSTSQEIERIRSSLQKKGTVYAISVHREPFKHWHIVHACPWRYYCCRCYSSGSPRRTCRTTKLSDATLADWNRIFIYLSTNGRQLQHISSGFASYSGIRGIKYVPDEGLCGLSRWEEPVEDCEDQGKNRVATKRAIDDSASVGSSSQQNTKLPKPNCKARYEDLESMIVRYACVPLQSVTNTSIWLKSQYRFIDSCNLRFRDVLASLRKQLSNWKYEDFMKLYKVSPLEVYWEAHITNVNDYYYDVYESREILIKLLEHQFYDIANADNITVSQAVTEFLQDVFDICEKNKPKRNTLELIGGAGSGKSYFADCITAFYLNVGHARNWNRNENFPLQSCINRRIILWNEAQVETSAHDSVKLLLGGDPCPANIKYMDIQTIPRTPIIITANRQYIPNTEPFNQRMSRYNWIPAPFLKDYVKKPHPLSYHKLLVEYNIVEQSLEDYDDSI